MLNSLRTAITTSFGNFSPAAFGITHDKNGTLQLDSSVLGTYLKTDLSGTIASLNKMGKSFDDSVTYFVNTAILQRRLTLTQAQLTKRFNDLDALIGNLQASGTALLQQLQSTSK